LVSGLAVHANECAVVTEATVVTAEAEGAVWTQYVSAHPDATVDHDWSWRPIFTNVFRQETTYLAARRGDRVVGVLPLVRFRSPLFGRALISLPFLNYGGVLGDDRVAVQALVDGAREHAQAFRASHVELRHRTRHCPGSPVRTHKLALTRSLPETPTALWDDIDRKVRNQVRKAQKEHLVARIGGAELIDAFYRVFSLNMRDLGTPVYSKRLFEHVLSAFGDRARVYLVERAGRTMAASMTLTFRDTVLVPWASSLREFRSLSPNTLLYWTMLESAVQSGARRFDFGRSSPGAGTHKFKLQWGAVEQPLAWEYVLLSMAAVPDHGPTNPKFDAAIALWKRCPLWLANAIGPHVVRVIP
jgi:FemAB-related protein (PEP-CTERM system-associated)